MAKLKRGTCRTMGRGKMLRYMCHKKVRGVWRTVFVKKSEYTRRKGSSPKKRKKRKSRR